MNLLKLAKKIVFAVVSGIFWVFTRLIRVDDKTLIFISYLGRGYLCSPKYIHQHLLKLYPDAGFKLVWALKDPTTPVPGAEVVKYRGFKYFYYLAKSKFWVVNSKLPEYCHKKPNQIYIQTWHGTPLKQLAHDIKVKEGTTFFRTRQTREEMLKSYDTDTRRYNYFLTTGRYATDRFKSCFKLKDEVIREYGYPRNDFLVNITLKEIEQIKDRLKIPKDKKVLLYAPTWRDNKFKASGYLFELKADFKKWREVLGEEWVVLFKPHYLIINKFKQPEGLEGFLYIFPEKEDINNLYVVSDLLVTDYSSAFFDYALLHRPILFYMYDKKQYAEEIRGYYLDMDSELPGQIVEDEDALLKLIKEGYAEGEENRIRVRRFAEKYCEADTGQAAQKVVENLILPHIP